MKNKLITTLISLSLMSVQSGLGMNQLPSEVIWNLLLRVTGAQAVARSVQYAYVCRYWHTIVMSNIGSQIDLCTQAEKNRFLLNTINTKTPEQIRDLLLRNGAAIHGSVKVLKNCLFYDFPSGAIEHIEPAYYDTSPWFHAVALADIASLSFFIKHGAAIDMQEDGTGQTALMKACNMGDTRLVEFLLQKGARLDQCCRALKTAYEYAHTKEMQLLLDRYQTKQIESADIFFCIGDDCMVIDPNQVLVTVWDDSDLVCPQQQVVFQEVRDYI